MKSAPRSPISKTRRYTRPLILCLVLGTLTTVLVAWALTFDFFRANAPMRFATFTTDNGRGISISRRETFGVIALASYMPSSNVYVLDEQMTTLEAIVPNWSRGELLDCWGAEPEPMLPLGTLRAIFITGWPVPCMWSSYDQQPSPNYWGFKARNGIRIGDMPAVPNHFSPLSPRERVLPTHLVWPVFLINTVLFSLIWAALLLTPRALRRTIRRRRGRCPACGYDRRGLNDEAACPECGWGRHEALGIGH